MKRLRGLVGLIVLASCGLTEPQITAECPMMAFVVIDTTRVPAKVDTIGRTWIKQFWCKVPEEKAR